MPMRHPRWRVRWFGPDGVGYPQNGVQRASGRSGVPTVTRVGRTTEPLAAAAAETRLRALLGRDEPAVPRSVPPGTMPSRGPVGHGAPAGPAWREGPAAERARDAGGAAAGERSTPSTGAVAELGGARAVYPERGVVGEGRPRAVPTTPAPDEDEIGGGDHTSPRRWPALDQVRDTLAAHTAALDPGRPGLRVLLLLGVLAAVVASVYVWRSRPEAEPLPPPIPAGAPQAAASPAPSSAEAARWRSSFPR